MQRPLPAELERRRFDLIVVGAGINGCGIARDAALRGLRVLLLDKGDLGGGTTSWSSRMIHGGLRYLEHGDVALVRESLRERERLLRNAPHLVKPLPLLLPLYRHNRRRPATIRAGMVAYDLLSLDKSLPRHRILDRAAALRRAPGLDPDGLLGAAVYYDAQVTFPERLAVENALSARDHGANVLTYARVERPLVVAGRVAGVEATDLISGATFRVEAPIVVNVAGPWVDQVLAGLDPPPATPLIGGTKGSHLVVDPFPGAPSVALYYEARTDQRVVLIIPWNGRYLIGATDLRYTGDLDCVETDEAEIAYLLNEANQVIPMARLTRDAVRFAYAGVRPLPYQPAGPEGAITRRHLIHDHTPVARGLLSIVGGKLTTYRSLAEEVVDRVVDSLGVAAPACRTADLALPGAAGVAFDFFARQFVGGSGLDAPAARRMLDVYGGRGSAVLALADEDPSLREPFDPETGALSAEVVWAVRQEDAQSLADVLFRRTMVGLNDRVGLGADEVAAAVAHRHLGWDETRVAQEIADYRSSAERLRPCAVPVRRG